MKNILKSLFHKNQISFKDVMSEQEKVDKITNDLIKANQKIIDDYYKKGNK